MVLLIVVLLLTSSLFPPFSAGSFFGNSLDVDLEAFDGESEAATLLKVTRDHDTEEGESEGQRGLLFFDKAPASIGERCNRWRQCDASNEHDLVCSERRIIGIGRRCLPAATACLMEAAKDLRSGSDFGAWQDEVMRSSGTNLQEFARARLAAGPSFERFQTTAPFQALKRAFLDHPPMDLLNELRYAADLCHGRTSENDSQPSEVIYMGLHIEMGYVADAAVSFGWALDDSAPSSFVRGTFGAEVGTGAELSGLLGFAFTGSEYTASDMNGNGVSVDADGNAFNLGGGIAVVTNTDNGLVSLELTAGLGLGFGVLGVAYSITAPLEDSTVAPTTAAPTASPSGGPSGQPSSAPTAFSASACTFPTTGTTACCGQPTCTGTATVLSPTVSNPLNPGTNTLTVTAPSVAPAMSDVTVYYCARGDLGSSSEYYNIQDENGNLIAQNCGESTFGDCDARWAESTKTISQATFNSWLGDSNVFFDFISTSPVDAAGSCINDEVFFVLNYST